MKKIKLVITFFLIAPLLSTATMWEDPWFDEAVRAAGLICTGTVETSSLQKTTVRLTSVLKGGGVKGDVVTIFRASVVGVGHERDRLRVGDRFLFLVKSYKNNYIAFTDTYWCFPLTASSVTLPIRDPSTYITVKRTPFEAFLHLLLVPRRLTEVSAFVNQQIKTIIPSDLASKASAEIEKQIFVLEVVSYFGSRADAVFLTRFLNSPYHQVRWSCIRALTTCGGTVSKTAILNHLPEEENETICSVLGGAVFTLAISEAKPLLEKQIPQLSADDVRLSTDIMNPRSNALPPARYAYGAALMKINGVQGTYKQLLLQAKEYLATYPAIRFNLLEGKKTYYSLEEALGQPDSVYILVLDRKDLTEVPREISQLKHLKSLSLFRNKLKQLPHFLADMNLLKLDVNDNLLEAVPQVVYRCMTLEELDLGGNAIKVLSKDIANLGGLKKLKLRMCKLEELPEEVSGLSKLEEIELYGNHFYRFPAVLTNCAALKVVHIGSNKIKRFPLDVAGMQKVKYVDLSYNELSAKERQLASRLPAGMSVNTETYSDRYYSLEEAIENNERAKAVHDNHSNYRLLSVDLGKLRAAEYLILTYDQLTRVPTGVTNLTKLKTLALHHNDIDSLPQDIGRMKSLTRLDLGFNKLRTLPASIKELPLTYLNLSHNDFSEEEKRKIETWVRKDCEIVWE